MNASCLTPSSQPPIRAQGLQYSENFCSRGLRLNVEPLCAHPNELSATLLESACQKGRIAQQRFQ